MPSSAPRRSLRQKHQTKIGFTPVASSSPAAAHLSPHVRTRAAAVTFTGSPSPAKRRKVLVSRREDENDSDDELGQAPGARDGEGPAKGLPTPEKSSQVKRPARRGKPSVESDSEACEEAGMGRAEESPVQKVRGITSGSEAAHCFVVWRRSAGTCKGL